LSVVILFDVAVANARHQTSMPMTLPSLAIPFVLVAKEEHVPVTAKRIADPVRMSAVTAPAVVLGEASTRPHVPATGLVPMTVAEAELALDVQAPSNAAGAGPSPVVAGVEPQPNYSTT
jgi:hypothetical protein